MIDTGKDLEDLKSRDSILEMYGVQNYFLSLLLCFLIRVAFKR